MGPFLSPSLINQRPVLRYRHCYIFLSKAGNSILHDARSLHLSSQLPWRIRPFLTQSMCGSKPHPRYTDVAACDSDPTAEVEGSLHPFPHLVSLSFELSKLCSTLRLRQDLLSCWAWSSSKASCSLHYQAHAGMFGQFSLLIGRVHIHLGGRAWPAPTTPMQGHHTAAKKILSPCLYVHLEVIAAG